MSDRYTRAMTLLTASMRPGPTRPGNRPVLVGVGETVEASMRPGPTRPGNLAQRLPEHADDHASMRPGPTRPGNVVSRPREPPVPTSFNEARADSPGKSEGMGVGDLGLVRFNEARADSPGKYGQRREPRHQDVLASMRPGPTRPGNGSRPCALAAQSACFNEARADSPGKLLALAAIPGRSGRLQ